MQNFKLYIFIFSLFVISISYGSDCPNTDLSNMNYSYLRNLSNIIDCPDKSNELYVWIQTFDKEKVDQIIYQFGMEDNPNPQTYDLLKFSIHPTAKGNYFKVSYCLSNDADYPYGKICAVLFNGKYINAEDIEKLFKSINEYNQGLNFWSKASFQILLLELQIIFPPAGSMLRSGALLVGMVGAEIVNDTIQDHYFKHIKIPEISDHNKNYHSVIYSNGYFYQMAESMKNSYDGFLNFVTCSFIEVEKGQNYFNMNCSRNAALPGK